MRSWRRAQERLQLVSDVRINCEGGRWDGNTMKHRFLPHKLQVLQVQLAVRVMILEFLKVTASRSRTRESALCRWNVFAVL